MSGTHITPADADDIANSMVCNESLIEGNIRALRASVKSLYTQLHNEQVARQNGDLDLRAELEQQRRMVAQMMRERESIETVCAWCGVHISGPTGVDPKHISHGICPACLEKNFPEKG